MCTEEEAQQAGDREAVREADSDQTTRKIAVDVGSR